MSAVERINAAECEIIPSLNPDYDGPHLWVESSLARELAAELDQRDAEIVRLRKVEHLAWHLCDDAEHRMNVKETVVDYEQFQALCAVLPERHPQQKISGNYEKTSFTRQDAEIGRLRDALRLPLLFHSGLPWKESVNEWNRITGNKEGTTRVMCDHIREALAPNQAAGKQERAK